MFVDLGCDFFECFMMVFGFNVVVVDEVCDVYCVVKVFGC